MKTNDFYSTKEVAFLLDIGESTLRKWCLCLENEGIFFEKKYDKTRVFTEKDLEILNEFKNLVKEEKMKKEEASLKIKEHHSEKNNTIIIPTPKDKQMALVIRTLKNHIDEQSNFIAQQQEFNQKLDERLERQEERAKERDENLMRVIRELQETKKEIVSSKDKWKKLKFWGKK